MSRAVKQPPFMITLISGIATREMTYAPNPAGEVKRVDDSGWDSPVEGMVEKATVEAKTQVGRVVFSITGRQFLAMEDCDAIGGMLEAVAAGKDPRDAVDQAMLLSAIL